MRRSIHSIFFVLIIPLLIVLLSATPLSILTVNASPEFAPQPPPPPIEGQQPPPPPIEGQQQLPQAPQADQPLSTQQQGTTQLDQSASQQQQVPTQRIVAWDANNQTRLIPLKALNDPIAKTAATIEGFQINQDNVVELRQNHNFVVRGDQLRDEDILQVTFSDLNGQGIVKLPQVSPESKNHWSIAGIAPERYFCDVLVQLPDGKEAIHETLCVIRSSDESPGTASSDLTGTNNNANNNDVTRRIIINVLVKNPPATVTPGTIPPIPNPGQPPIITPPIQPTTGATRLPPACPPGLSPPTSFCTPGVRPGPNGECPPGQVIAPGTSLCFPRETIPPGANPSGAGGLNQPPRPFGPLGSATPGVCDGNLVLIVTLTGFMCAAPVVGPINIGVPGGQTPPPCGPGGPLRPPGPPPSGGVGTTEPGTEPGITLCTPGTPPGPDGTCPPDKIKAADGLCYPAHIVIPGPGIIPQGAAATGGGAAAGGTPPEGAVKPDTICGQGFILEKRPPTQADICQPVDIPEDTDTDPEDPDTDPEDPTCPDDEVLEDGECVEPPDPDTGGNPGDVPPPSDGGNPGDGATAA
jgi:hypothetical protein